MPRLIDAHNHLVLREGDEDVLLRGMDEAGVEKTVLLAIAPIRLEFCEGEIAGNEAVSAACQRHPDRFLHFVGVDPREPDAGATVRRYVDLGAAGIKLFPPAGYYPDDPACFALYETAADLRLPILSHTGATNLRVLGSEDRRATWSHFADPIRFDGLARLFPEVTWILAHMGYPWSVNAWAVAAGNPDNVYLDLCADGPWLMYHPAAYRAIDRRIPIDFNRVLWGTDRIHSPRVHIPLVEQVLRRLGCDEAALPGVFGENACRLLRL